MTTPTGHPGDRPGAQRPPAREFDALAELFLGDAETSPTPDAIPFPRAEHESSPASEGAQAIAPVEQPMVEVLIMGHLPVRSGPWALQYAAAVARTEHTSVALARLSPRDDGQSPRLAIDLLGTQPAWTGAAPPSLAEALDHARAGAQRWILLVNELDEAEAIATPGLDAVTLLSGANDAAVVDAYRMLKAMVSSADASDLPLVQLAIMGADDERASGASRKLLQGARTFLSLEVELAPSLGKMGPTGATSLFRGPTDLDAAALVALLRTPRETRPTGAAPRQPQAPAPTAPPVALAEAKTAAPLASSELAGLIEGLTPLGVECPAARSVQLAADASGRMHLLAEGADALQALSQAAGWAQLHRSLLAQATGVALQKDAIEQHLFTADAKSVRWLLDADIRVHVLAKTTVRGESITLACALN